MKVLAILGLSLLVLVAGAAPAMAFDPQEGLPVQALVNQLNSVANVLAAVDHGLEAVLMEPPDPSSPGLIGRLNAMTSQLEVQLGRVEAVLVVPPDPSTPEFRAALANVRGAALGIVARASDPPDPNREVPALMAALEGVKNAAQAIANLAGGIG